jgi:hypothetical protein
LLINKKLLTQWKFKCEFWLYAMCHTFLPQSWRLLAAFKRKCLNNLYFWLLKNETVMKKLCKENGSGLTREYCVYAIVWLDYFQLAERYKYVYSLYFQSKSNDFEVSEISTFFITQCVACLQRIHYHLLPNLQVYLVHLGHPWISKRITF